MTRNVFKITLRELTRDMPQKGTKGNQITPSCLHYSAPSAGGWGIVRTALLVPDSIMLFVAPHGCGRHGSVSSIQLGLRNRIYYMDITEEDLVLGSHVDRIELAVDHILKNRKTRPKAFMITASCIDDLLATDYVNIVSRLTKRHGIPFVDCHMNPITANSSLPPPLHIQRSIYRFLSEAKTERQPDDAINLIGHFTPLQPSCELYELMAAAGFDVRQISACDTFETYMAMRNSRFNLLIKPFGRVACEQMKRQLDIPWQRSFVAYEPAAVTAQYEALSSFIGRRLDDAPYGEAARQECRRLAGPLAGLRVGIGSSVNGSAFDIALTLLDFGLDVTFIMSAGILDWEWDAVERLQRRKPDLPVYTGYHPSMAMIDKIPETADVAIGFDASYICPEAKLFALDADLQYWGHAATTGLFRGIRDALDNPVSARELMYSKGLVV